MAPTSGSRVRAAFLAAAMNVGTAVALDPLRFLRVPAIHFVLRRRHRCDRTCLNAPRRRGRWLRAGRP